MNKRQAKKKMKIDAYRSEYDFLPIKVIKKYNRQYDAYFNSPQGKKQIKREKQISEF